MASDLINRVHGLLKLAANNPNAEEAAAAAAMAQRLIDEHNLAGALLEYDGTKRDDEPIIDFSEKGAPLDGTSPTKLIRWRSSLAMSLAYYNSCRIFFTSGTLHIVGRPSDVDTVRYLYAYITGETERLCAKDGAGCGRTWRNNYRLGVIDTIRRRLRTSHDEFVAEQRRLAGATSGTALMRLDGALLRLEQRGKKAQEKLDAKPGMRKIKLTQGKAIKDARQAGQQAGESINLEKARRGLGGQKGLTS